MNFMELAKARYSVRKYSDKPIEKEKLDLILEAGRIAPTGHNNQPYRVYVLKSPEALEKVRGLTRCAFNAPVVLMVTVRKDEEWVNPFEHGIRAGEQDASIVATHMMLEAWELGIRLLLGELLPGVQNRRCFRAASERSAPAAAAHRLRCRRRASGPPAHRTPFQRRTGEGTVRRRLNKMVLPHPKGCSRTIF